jgi:hypothetical protein
LPVWLDKRYINMVSNRLPNFKWKKPTLANFRCVYCGDSQKNKRKARGYLFESNGNYFFKCWNCEESTIFSKFLEHVAPELYLDYVRDSFAERSNTSFSLESIKASPRGQTILSKYPKYDKLKYCSRIGQLTKNHPAPVYLAKRQIPSGQYHNLLYTDSLRLFITENIDKSQIYLPDDPAIVILIRDTKGNIVACNCRNLSDRANVKYIKAKVDEDIVPIYGIDSIKRDMKVYVFEGEFNSMFVRNAVSCGGAAVMNGVENILGVNKELIVQVVDNDPRNPHVVKILENLIDEGYSVVILPNTIEESDVNDLIMNAKLDIASVTNFLELNTYRGLSAKLELSLWRKCDVAQSNAYRGR